MTAPNTDLIIPPALRHGDRAAIICPAGRARIDNCEAAAEVLASAGLRPELSPMVYGNCGSFSGTVADRTADFQRVWTDRGIRAVICSRGGYGSLHLLEQLDTMPLRDNAKWLVGFSDICVLHALMNRHGIASIHGPMAKHISADGGRNPNFEALMRTLCGEMPAFHFAPHPFNRHGEAEATLTGGNLSVLSALTGTRFDTLRPGTILLIEDIAEPVYKVQRMLWQLRLSGVLPRLSGLLVGAFTDWRPDVNHESMQSMIRDMVAGYSFPMAFDVPVGHAGDAMPLVLGAPSRLRVSDTGVEFDQFRKV